MRPGRFTELFFLDEASAFAAGHRPCAECRREDYVRFIEIWRAHYPADRGADAVDARLHDERIDPSTHGQRHHQVSAGDLPDGAFVLIEGDAWLVRGDEVLRWSPAGYSDRRARPTGTLTLVTPPSLLDVLRARREPVVPFLHPSALR
jgi:hypothetical protein